MRFFGTVLAGAALFAGAMAQLAINDYPSSGVEAGKTYTITYSPKDQVPTEIILRQGPSNNLNTIATLGTATGGSFTWTVAANLPNQADYAIEVRRGSTNNFSGQFGLTGGSAAVSSAVASASAALSSASAALSSVRASASSAIASITSRASSAAASASASVTAGSNSTVTSATLSRTPSASVSGSRTASASGPPQNTANAAAGFESSPAALVFGAVAAFFALA